MSRARDVADTQDNVGGAVAPFVAGKNVIINGGMDIWQRGTSGSVGGSILYIADRWQSLIFAGGTMNWSQVATSNTPVGSRFALRVQRPNGATNTATMNIGYSVETNDSLRFAGQTFTLSFWAKANANFSAASNLLNVQVATGTGTDQAVYAGFTNAATPVNTTATLTTSWQRFTFTGTAASTATQIGLVFYYAPTGTAGAADSYDITNVQLELGNQATPFARSGGSIGGELALCQRYYWRVNATNTYSRYSSAGSADSTTNVSVFVNNPVPMRVPATSIEGLNLTLYGGAFGTLSTATLANDSTTLITQVGCAGSGLTQFRAYNLLANNTTNSYFAASAEL